MVGRRVIDLRASPQNVWFHECYYRLTLLQLRLGEAARATSHIEARLRLLPLRPSHVYKSSERWHLLGANYRQRFSVSRSLHL